MQKRQRGALDRVLEWKLKLTRAEAPRYLVKPSAPSVIGVRRQNSEGRLWAIAAPVFFLA